ncbi:dipeptidyl aminopeptidase/acylaminoacyl peptidase [Lewinella aquimaris]|uniref:Dipeptidyl aminopeptidase/acylaminoacyl peptidase n=1 Tax=Neolewinella aquimaris TaxID=1835722 RepID=A0A840E6U1_9BACT|nr:alpha/beta fold hydrolase [Neolewinella aquimaris]MBB4077808.1 dipeptidyl aminopeptidase/acylaminoacyl peptidase [Neolewinella aquimaris]
MKTFLFFLAALVVLYVGITFFVSNLVLDTPNRSLEESYRIATEQWKVNIDSIRGELPPPTEVSFRSPVDGLNLRGWYYQQDNADCAVIFAHGYHDNRLSMLKYTPYFDRCNCDLLLYDHRGFGESDEAYGTGGVNEATDLLAAHAYLKSVTGLPDDRIGWFGESWGAATALLAAGRETVDPAFVIAESPYADWETAITERGVRDFGPVLSALTPGTFRWVSFRSGTDFMSASPLRAGEKIRVPVLLLHSLADTLTAPGQSDLIAEKIDTGLLTYHRLDWGAWHAHNVVWNSREYERLLERFIMHRSPGFCTE